RCVRFAPAVSQSLMVLEPVRAIFRAIATAIVPELASMAPATWDEMEATIENALSARSPRVQRQLVSFIRILDWWALARFRRRLTKLDRAKRTRLLESVERHPLLLVRRGMWALRTLVFMGYYTRADVAAHIGYRAHPDGWSARPEAARERPSVTPKDVGVASPRRLV
ncbi:MAG: hypothetical protein ACT4R6_00085, partial [Gemmatimonadaceae bacterium]